MRKHEIEKILSQYQIESDKVVFKYIKANKELEKLRLLSVFQEIVDFNAILTLSKVIPLIIRVDAIKFALKCKNEFKRKMSLSDMLNYSEMYNFVSAFGYNFDSLEELKNMYKKTRPCSKLKKE